MANPQKMQGTRQESAIVKRFKAEGFPSAERIAEGGSADEGDVKVSLFNVKWVCESKARANLNIQDTLAKTRKKAGGSPVIVFWKRLVRVEGQARRKAVGGESEVIILSPSDFFKLLRDAKQDGYNLGKEAYNTKRYM